MVIHGVVYYVILVFLRAYAGMSDNVSLTVMFLWDSGIAGRQSNGAQVYRRYFRRKHKTDTLSVSDSENAPNTT